MNDVERIRVLLIDDAVELRSLLRVLLERSGSVSVVGEAGDVSSAEELVRTTGPDAVIVDLAMPGGGALELITRLRAAEPSLGIVVLSGYPAATTADRCLASGADSYVEKGTSFAVLLETVLAAVRKVRA
jgi:two-component system invasion response regulator UvrY